MLESMLDENSICLNEVILAELIPYLRVHKSYHVIDLIRSVTVKPLNIEWDEIIGFQVKLIKNGINRVGIPDLLIVQNALHNNLQLYSLDKHFKLINEVIPLSLFDI